MKIGFYDPYLDTLGGGERYLLVLADYLRQKNHQVDIFWSKKPMKTPPASRLGESSYVAALPSLRSGGGSGRSSDPHLAADVIKKEIKIKFGLDLKKINFVEDIFSSRTNLFQKWRKTRKYEVIFFLSDGSLPFLFAKKNILIFLVPFTRVNGRSFLNKIKLLKMARIVTISQFNKKFIDREYGVKSLVISPPVSVETFRPGKKEKLIISVGRFYQPLKESKGLIRPLHSKKQAVLIEVFKQMCDQGLKDWRLLLLGGMAKKDEAYLNHLKKASADYPIEIKTNLSLAALKKNYARAKIYWHAAGFGEEEEEHPERMEHFGITTVEAMAAGGVPVVAAKGGQPEIVKDKITGFLWQSKDELAQRTRQLIKSPKLWQRLSLKAIKESQNWRQEVFCQKFDEIIKS